MKSLPHTLKKCGDPATVTELLRLAMADASTRPTLDELPPLRVAPHDPMSFVGDDLAERLIAHVTDSREFIEYAKGKDSPELRDGLSQNPHMSKRDLKDIGYVLDSRWRSPRHALQPAHYESYVEHLETSGYVLSKEEVTTVLRQVLYHEEARHGIRMVGGFPDWRVRQGVLAILLGNHNLSPKMVDAFIARGPSQGSWNGPYIQVAGRLHVLGQDDTVRLLEAFMEWSEHGYWVAPELVTALAFKGAHPIPRHLQEWLLSLPGATHALNQACVPAPLASIDPSLLADHLKSSTSNLLLALHGGLFNNMTDKQLAALPPEWSVVLPRLAAMVLAGRCEADFDAAAARRAGELAVFLRQAEPKLDGRTVEEAFLHFLACMPDAAKVEAVRGTGSPAPARCRDAVEGIAFGLLPPEAWSVYFRLTDDDPALNPVETLEAAAAAHSVLMPWPAFEAIKGTKSSSPPKRPKHEQGELFQM